MITQENRLNYHLSAIYHQEHWHNVYDQIIIRVLPHNHKTCNIIFDKQPLWESFNSKWINIQEWNGIRISRIRFMESIIIECSRRFCYIVAFHKSNMYVWKSGRQFWINFSRNETYIYTNRLRAKFFIENKSIFLHLLSFHHIDSTHVVEMFDQVRQELLHISTYPISWVRMSWRRKEPVHQQPWYLICWSEVIQSPHVNTLRPRQNGRHFADDIFKCIFLNENVWISNKISLKFVPKGPINNIPALVQIIIWSNDA